MVLKNADSGRQMWLRSMIGVPVTGVFDKGHIRMLIKETFPIEKIHVPVKRMKTLDPAKVDEIAESMLEDGQTTPIRLRAGKDRFVLIEGMHRLEALKALGENTVEGYLVKAQLH